MALGALLGQVRPTNIQEAQAQQLEQQARQQQMHQGAAIFQQQQQSAQEEQANKRRSMAISMLNGIAREQDPAKQATLYATLKPMAERYDPTLKLPDQYDSGLTSALQASQMSPKDFFAAQKADLPTGYRMNPVTGMAELIPGVDPSFGKKADPFAMPMPVQTPDGRVTFATKGDVVANPNGYAPPPQPGAGKPPAGYTWGPDGQTLVPIPGGPADQDTKPVTEYQGKSGTFAARMNEAESVIQSMQDAGLDPTQAFKAGIPLVGNYMVSDQYQQLDQAERNFLNAVLRQESGAAISPSEFQNAIKQYFPQPGDTPETLAQKKQNRLTAISQMEKMAGRAYEKPQQPGQTGGWSIKRVQ